MPLLRALAGALVVCVVAGCASLNGSQPPAAGTAATATPMAGTVAAAAAATDAVADTDPVPQDTDAAPVTAWKDVTVAGAEPIADLWVRMRKGFSLPDGNEARVTRQMQWYESHPGYMMRTGQRAKPYLYYIVEQIAKRGMPMDLALLPVVESAFNPFGYSYADASGLWQFIPSTGRNYGLKQNWWYDGRRDVIAATNAALDLLQDLHKRFHGDWLLALAAYNSGGITVERAIARNKRRGEPTDFWHLRLPRQTRAYVPRLLAVRDLVAHPEKYGIELPFIANVPYLARIDLDGQIDIAIAADMAGLSVKQMYLLNPGYSRWATPPDGPSYLLVPRDEKQDFLAKLEGMKKTIMAKWIAHRIQRGETLSEIADHYHTTVAVLRHRNNIRGSMIRAGHTLMIPSPSAQVTRYVSPGASQGIARSGRPSTVRVKRGDTLWELARSHHVSVAQLARWNNISKHSTLRIGQSLKVWPGGGSPVVAAGGSGRNSSVGSRVIRVSRGDSLWKIAQRYHVSVAQIAAWNDVSANAVLHVGDELKIRPAAADTDSDSHRIHYTVRNGDSLWSISDHFNVSLRKLADWNSISLSSIIHPGQQLTLFVTSGG